jgi:hypothetical protein
LGFGDEAEVCVLAWGKSALAIVNFGHGSAEASNINGGGRNFSCEAGLMEESDDLLSFAHGKDRHEDSSATFEGGTDGGEEFFFEVSAIVAREGGLGPAGGLHDQGIERACGSLAREHKRLALQIEVAGVEGAATMGSNFRKDRTENVTRVVKNKFEFGGGAHAERAIQVC